MITLAATPIGNPEDASPHLRRLLTDADVIAAEDTRKLHDLLRRINVTTNARIVSYHEHNEAERTPELIAFAQEGDHVVVISDAGMPGISDPGYRLVRSAHDHGLGLTVAPGPSAVVAALAVSGLPTDRFCFEGFLPRKAVARKEAVAKLAQEQRTMVFYEAPHRLAQTVETLIEVFGAEREATMCREITKTHEEILAGTLGEIHQRATRGVKGEVVLVVGGFTTPKGDVGSAIGLVLELMDKGEPMKTAVQQVAHEVGVRRRALYEAVLEAKN